MAQLTESTANSYAELVAMSPRQLLMLHEDILDMQPKEQ